MICTTWKPCSLNSRNSPGSAATVAGCSSCRSDVPLPHFSRRFMARWMIWAKRYAAVPVIGSDIGAEGDERTRGQHIFNGLRAAEARNTESSARDHRGRYSPQPTFRAVSQTFSNRRDCSSSKAAGAVARNSNGGSDGSSDGDRPTHRPMTVLYRMPSALPRPKYPKSVSSFGLSCLVEVQESCLIRTAADPPARPCVLRSATPPTRGTQT